LEGCLWARSRPASYIYSIYYIPLFLLPRPVPQPLEQSTPHY
jgi:hypothetical protein